MSQPANSKRFALWVDAVGGYLVCLSDEITIGQAIPKNEVDLAVMGDISRRHAKLRRTGDGYFVEPLQKVFIAGKEITGPTLVANGDEIQLGRSVRFNFRQPNGLSATATLKLVSPHRLQPSADTVLMMGESCILGPKPFSHIVCPEWPSDVVLFRQGKDLYCRSGGNLEIDGQKAPGRGKITTKSRVVGDFFCLSLEEL